MEETGYRTLLVDFDSQANLSKGLGISEPAKDENTICQPMWADMRDLEMSDKSGYIKRRGKIDFISCNETLSVLELEMVSAMRREYILKNAFDELRPGFDFILVDCGPSLDTLFGCAETSDDQIATKGDTLIDEFPGHPYHLYSGKRHTDLLESIKEFGVLTSVILRAERGRTIYHACRL